MSSSSWAPEAASAAPAAVLAFVASILGVRRARVSAPARMLQDGGLIHYRRGRVRGLDPATLEPTYCECYGVIRRFAAPS